jgi:hypothetical protein
MRTRSHSWEEEGRPLGILLQLVSGLASRYTAEFCVCKTNGNDPRNESNNNGVEHSSELFK